VFYNTHHPIKSARAKAGRWGNLLKTAPRRQTCAGCAGSVIVVFSGIARGGSPTSWSLFSPNPRAPFCAGCVSLPASRGSFYFIHFDLSLKPRPGLPAGVKGDEWQVRGDGFYHMMKYLVAPAQMPDSLTWFKWEATGRG
jgi:hypothetical protein